MLVELSSLQEMAMKLYERHQSGLLSLQEYLHLMIPIDEAIDKIEMQALSCQLIDIKVP